MKMPIKFMIGIAVVAAGWFFYMNSGGDTGEVNRKIGYTETYSEEDIIAAMDVVERKFKQKFTGCILTDLWYDEFHNDRMADEWKEQYEADEAIVFLITYYFDEAAGAYSSFLSADVFYQ